MFRADSAHEMTVCTTELLRRTIASIYTFMKNMSLLHVFLDTSSYQDRGSEGDNWPLPLGCSFFVHRYDTSTFVGNHFFLSQNVCITDRRSADIHVVDFLDDCNNNVVYLSCPAPLPTHLPAMGFICLHG